MADNSRMYRYNIQYKIDNNESEPYEGFTVIASSPLKAIEIAEAAIKSVWAGASYWEVVGCQYLETIRKDCVEK